ncbi:heparan-alpha-glucosaminide N-acetyltransferase [Peptoniphilus stercorisuis]|uniref:Membrane protein n=1 Tax=Peptoniphilus stercorisuis TaxID=1436965 RepID=A0ABS4K9P5_9FIRM|nr:heparan-alpha-glucosaminide N-acetyltransferase [Peptoniphilus stercorisuis]MBP2024489.1 putative membrane protein [Peptoniphilus stercorisuis]
MKKLNLEKRNHYIDMIRGISLISMILYHLFYDLVYVFNINIDFYRLNNVKPWQLSICITFILISGISFHFYKNHRKQGLIVFGLSLLISLITYIFIPEEAVKFGVLSLIGASIIIMDLLNKFLNKLNPYFGFVLFILLFLIFYNLPYGNLGISSIEILNIPDYIYKSKYLYPIGLPHEDFVSADYFPLFPWSFLFISGYFLGHILKRKNLLKPMGKNNIISAIGRHSLVVYLLHQPILYFGLFIIFEIIIRR